MDTTLAAIQYYIREKYWHHIATICIEELRKGPDPVISFWRSFSLFNEGAVTEAIREAEQQIQRRETNYACMAAAIYYHKKCRIVDYDAVARYKSQLSSMLSQSSDQALLLGAQFYTHIGKFGKCGQICEQVLNQNPNNYQALMVAGWNHLLSDVENKSLAQKYFMKIVSESGDQAYYKYLDALLGLAKYNELVKNFKANIEIQNDILVKTNNFVPVMIEKAKVLMMIGDWDQILEMVYRIIQISPGNIEALRIWIFYLLSREANHEMASEKLNEMIANINQKEPKNPDLILSIVRPLARISGRNEQILRGTLSLTQQARRLRQDDAEIVIEVGEQLRLLGDYNAAIQAFTEASSKDETNVIPLLRQVHCKIQQGELLEASSQLEFLTEIIDSSNTTSEIVFLQSMIEWRLNQDKKQALTLLDKALSLHVAASKRLNPGYEFYTQLNPDFLLEMSKEYLQYIGLSPLPKTSKPPHYLIRGTKLLETLTKQIPGIIEAQLLLAKAKFVANETAAAQKHISICLQMDPNFIDTLILSALISIQSSQYLAASQAVEQALARNFLIRENPLFMLVKGKVEMKLKKYSDAMKTLESAMDLPGVRDPNDNVVRKTSLFLNLSIEDRASIYINLALAYAELDRMQDATRTIQDAIGEFTGSQAEVQVLIANSELALKRNDLKQAINILNGVQSDSPHYKEAKIAQAEIYLNQMSSRRIYAKCYYDIVQQEDSVENYLLLGEALMRIQEPEEAIKVYEKALRQKTDDLFLTREIGRALVLTHDYKRAIEYYESAMRNDAHRSELTTDLANLYLKLKDFRRASEILQEALRQIDQNDLNSIGRGAKNYLLLAKVILSSRKDEDPLNLQPIPDCATALQNARTLQKQLLSQAREIPPDQIQGHRELAAQISFMLGEYTQQREKDLDQAQQFYQEALNYEEMHSKSIIQLARLNQQKNDAQKCMQFCSMMLRIDPANEEASTMMAEQLFQQNQVDRAIACYQQQLDNKPDNYRVLAQIIQLLRRSGRLEKSQGYLKNALKVAGRHSNAGLAYCKGLSMRYQGKALEALQEFNKARNDSEYGEMSIQMMIDIYLNPDNEPMWVETSINRENVQFAQQLLDELKMKSNSMKSVVLETLIEIAKSGRGADQVVNRLETVIGNNPNFVPAYVAYAMGKIAGQRPSEAMQMLQRLSQLPFQGEYAEDFERSWLIYADLLIKENNDSNATQVLEKCLTHNKSCGKARELLGYIKERENNSIEASKHYEDAWKFTNNASIGYRLAFNYMKDNRFTQAITICKEVLKKYPDYPKIQEEILDRARSMVRPQLVSNF